MAGYAHNSKAESEIILAPEPASGSGYISAGMADSSNNIVAGKGPIDLPLSLVHGLAISVQMDKGGQLASGAETKGGGTSPEDAIEFPGLEKQQIAVAVALSYIANRFPDRREIRARFCHGPGDVFVTRIAFETAQGPHALYFDRTEWAIAWRAELGK